MTLEYPETRRGDHVDDYHGTDVADPYRWLEDADSEETAAWVEAQNAVTFAHLEALPARGAIKERLTELWDYAKYGVPWRRPGKTFFHKNDGLQNQAVLWWQPDGGEEQVLLDPNTLSEDGTVALTGLAMSEDGNLMAYGLSESGSDWQTWKFREIETGEDRDDELNWVKFTGAAWTHDGAGFYYSRYAEPDPDTSKEEALYNQKLYYHRLGTAQSEDVLVYERPDQKKWGFSGQVTRDGRYLVIHVWEGTERNNALFVLDLEVPGAEVVELLKDWDASYDFVGNDGSLFWIKTDLDAPRGRLIAIDLETPARDQWAEVIPQSEDTLQGVSVVAERFLVTTLHHAHSKVRVYSLEGAFELEVELPGLGTAVGFGGRRHHTDTFYAFTSFTRPTTIYRYEVAEDRSSILRQPDVPFDPDRYETQQVFVTSKDGTQVPMFLSYARGTEPTKGAAGHATYLYGYGGFNNPMTPAFSISYLVWMERGGVLAFTCLRGGGEYGEEWHKAGTKENKQNVFDDFIACAEWLQAEGWTSKERLAIGGGSNGGLLVGACMTQRPDLYAACLPAVGVMDMLRFHKWTIGWAWTSDYGCADEADQFPYLYAYSPLHNLKEGTAYPATLITTADHDDRVVPAHSFKFAAALQRAHTGDDPVLIRIEVKAGHGMGKPTSKVIDEVADKWAFLGDVLGMD